MKYLILVSVIVILFIFIWVFLHPSSNSGIGKKYVSENKSLCECQNKKTQMALIALNAKIQALQNELAELKDKQLGMDDRQNDSPVDDGSASGDGEMEAVNMPGDRVAFLNASISVSAQSGRRDVSFENEIINRFSDPRLASTAVSNIACSPEFCRAQLNTNNLDANDQLSSSLSETGVLEGEAFFQSSDQADNGIFNTVVYFSRAGYQLPQPDIGSR